jgi:predicted DNA-binding protein (MmcQ/YjbR family)
MDIDDLRVYCLNKKEVTEGFPFGENTLVFKVKNKIFCLADISGRLKINLKCDPEKGAEYREEHEEIVPGYHMNKKHWNTVDLEGRLTESFIKGLIDDSYYLVISTLSKKDRNSLIS